MIVTVLESCPLHLLLQICNVLPEFPSELWSHLYLVLACMVAYCGQHPCSYLHLENLELRLAFQRTNKSHEVASGLCAVDVAKLKTFLNRGVEDNAV